MPNYKKWAKALAFDKKPTQISRGGGQHQNTGMHTLTKYHIWPEWLKLKRLTANTQC